MNSEIISFSKMNRPIKPGDVRENRQLASMRYLELLVKALREFDSDESQTSIERICERVEISPEKFKLHHSKLDHFEEHLDDGDTYARAVQVLEFQALRVHRAKVKQFLRENQIKEPSLNNLVRYGKRFLNCVDWLPSNFKVGKTWAQELRCEVSPRKNKYLKAKLKPFANWLQRELEKDSSVSNEDVKAKYTELFGAPKSQSAWSKFARRMRRRFDLQSVQVRGADGRWKYFWSREDEDSDDDE